jgi:hypothetical protein
MLQTDLLKQKVTESSPIQVITVTPCDTRIIKEKTCI